MEMKHIRVCLQLAWDISQLCSFIVLPDGTDLFTCSYPIFTPMSDSPSGIFLFWGFFF